MKDIIIRFRVRIISVSIVVSMLSYNGLVGQSTFEPGYIITNDQDSIQGYIEYDNWKVNPELIKFKSDQNENVRAFSPSDISGFSVNNYFFRSANASLNSAFQKGSSFSKTPNIEYTEKAVFLEELVGGPKGLYLYRDGSRMERFYISMNNKVQLLLHQEYEFAQFGENPERRSINKYLGQLYAYLADCKSIEQAIRDASYNAKSLINIFKAYYSCVGYNDSVRLKKVDKANQNISLFAGLLMTDLRFSGDESNAVTQTDFPVSTNIVFGAGLELFFSSKKDLSLNANVLFTRFKAEGNHLEVRAPDNTIQTQSMIDFSHVKLLMMMRYGIYINRFRLYADVGFSYGQAIENTNLKRVEERFLGGMNISELPLVSSVKAVESGLSLGVGVNFKRYSLGFRHESAGGVSREANLESKTFRLYILAGLILWQ